MYLWCIQKYLQETLSFLCKVRRKLFRRSTNRRCSRIYYPKLKLFNYEGNKIMGGGGGGATPLMLIPI